MVVMPLWISSVQLCVIGLVQLTEILLQLRQQKAVLLDPSSIPTEAIKFLIARYCIRMAMKLLDAFRSVTELCIFLPRISKCFTKSGNFTDTFTLAQLCLVQTSPEWCYPHFTVVAMEALRSYVNCPSADSDAVMELALEPRSPNIQFCALTTWDPCLPYTQKHYELEQVSMCLFLTGRCVMYFCPYFINESQMSFLHCSFFLAQQQLGVPHTLQDQHHTLWIRRAQSSAQLGL